MGVRQRPCRSWGWGCCPVHSTVAPALPVLVLSMHAEPLYVTRAMEAGARGYVSKNIAPDELVTGIRQVASGGH